MAFGTLSSLVIYSGGAFNIGELHIGTTYADVTPTAAATNNSVLSASTSSVAFGRVMLNYVPTTNVSVSLSSGTGSTGFSVSANGGATATATGNGPGGIPPSATVTVGLTNATGSYSGTVQVQNSGDDGSGDGPSSAGAGQGNAQSPISISVTGTVVDNRVVTSTSASFGLVHLGSRSSQGDHPLHHRRR